MFDGTLARATGTVSSFGAFMDSVFDRWGEAIVYLGIAWGAVLAGSGSRSRSSPPAALGAAFMVSYTRAKSEGLGFSPGTGMAADRRHAARDPARHPQRRSPPRRS